MRRGREAKNGFDIVLQALGINAVAPVRERIVMITY
jgi:hypothetical protein